MPLTPRFVIALALLFIGVAASAAAVTAFGSSTPTATFTSTSSSEPPAATQQSSVSYLSGAVDVIGSAVYSGATNLGTHVSAWQQSDATTATEQTYTSPAPAVTTTSTPGATETQEPTATAQTTQTTVDQIGANVVTAGSTSFDDTAAVGLDANEPTNGPVTQTTTNGNASASVTVNIGQPQSGQNGFSISLSQACSANGSCGNAGAAALTNGAQSTAGGHSQATAGEGETADASASADANGCSELATPVVSSLITINPDGSFQRSFSYTVGVSCTKTDVTITQNP
jgi:hypothetical protein